jgi:cysteine desulfurase / selenocysteine lyase
MSSGRTNRFADHVLTIRRRLPLLESGVSFNHAGIAPQPLSDAVCEFESRRARMLPGAALEGIGALKKEIRESYGRLLNVSPAEIAITRHTAEGVNSVAQGLDWKPGDRILTVDVEYPSNVYPWWNLRDRGVEILSVPERNGRVDIEEFLAAIHPTIRLVAISHVEFASGFAFDLPRVARRCQEQGVMLFVDIAQSIGLLPVDLSLVDAAAWPTWKWLMGPIGMGGFYISDRLLPKIKPVFVGTDGMVPTPDYLDYRFEFRPDAARFEYSTENTLGLIGTAEALRRILPLFGGDLAGLAADRVWELGDQITSVLENKGFSLYSSKLPGERSGILSYVTPETPASVASALRKCGVEVSVRASRLRIAPHFYNDESDVERLASAL